MAANPISEETEDPLAPAKGLANGCLISAAIWLIVLAVIEIIVRLAR
jgi:hypothetical protein